MHGPTAHLDERSDPPGRRIVILGRPGAGKSTLAEEFGRITGLSVVHLDELYWTEDLRPPPEAEWLRREERIIAGDEWIVEGQLGRADVVGRRIARAEIVVVLDLPAWLCALRSIRRGRERRDFWIWLLSWRRRGLPPIRRAVEESGAAAEVVTLRSEAEVSALVEGVRRGGGKGAELGGQGDR